MTTRALSCHATYACRESGACCTSGWPIEIEPDRLAAAERAIAAGMIVVPHVSPGLKTRGSTRQTQPPIVGSDLSVSRPTDLSVRSPGSSDPGRRESRPTLLPMVDGACVFHRASGSARCTLHHALGHAALPLACRQFPRVVVVDPRGVSVTLSHYCPTAAAMLETTAPIAIVTDADAFPPGGEYVGLDVRDGLPPALRPDMLMGWEDWWHWEEQAVALLSAVDVTADALARLAHAVEFTREWCPADGPLRDRIDAAFQSARHDTPARVATACRSDDAMADVVAAVPDGMRRDARRAIGTRGARVSIHVHRQLLVAHAFANWTAHIGEGLRTWLRSIETAHALLLSGLGVRDVDLLLRHLVDPRALAERWMGVEGHE